MMILQFVQSGCCSACHSARQRYIIYYSRPLGAWGHYTSPIPRSIWQDVCERTKQAVDETKAVSKSSEVISNINKLMTHVKSLDSQIGGAKLNALVSDCPNVSDYIKACQASKAEGSEEAAQRLQESLAMVKDWLESEDMKAAGTNFGKLLQDLWLGEGASVLHLPCRDDPKAMKLIWAAVLAGRGDSSLTCPTI